MEARLIHSMLDGVPGVLAVDVMVVTKIVAVTHEPARISPAALASALNSAGLQARLASGHGGGSQEPLKRPPRDGVLRCLACLRWHPALPPPLVVVAGLLLLVNLLLLLLVPGPRVPWLLQQGVLALIAAAIAIPPVLRKAWAGLAARNVDMNCLVRVGGAAAAGACSRAVMLCVRSSHTCALSCAMVCMRPQRLR